MTIKTEANGGHLAQFKNHSNHAIAITTYEGDNGRAYLECSDCKQVVLQLDGPQGVSVEHLASAAGDLLDRGGSQPKGTLFDLDTEELSLFEKIEELFQRSMDETINLEEESKRLVDEHLERLGEVQGRLSTKLIGYVETIKVLIAKAKMLETEAGLYEAERKRLQSKAADNVSTAEFLQSRLKAFMERRMLVALEVGTYQLKIVNQGGIPPLLLVPGITPEQVPIEFRRQIPASVTFDKEAIHAALREGQQLVIESPIEGAAAATEANDSKALRAKVQWARHSDRPTKLKIT